MRKLFTGAVVASATLALAGGAIAQVSNEAGDSTFDATATPSKAGTKTKPKSVAVRTNLTINRPGTTVGVITLTLGKGLKFSGEGFKKCNAQTLLDNGIAACPSGSKVGPTGRATALIEPGNGSLNFAVHPFVKNAKTFLFYLEGIEGNGVQDVLQGKITNRGRQIAITIPEALRQPAGLDATLTGIDQTFSGKRGKRAIVTSTGCKGGSWKISGKLTFSTRSNGTPPGPSETLTDPVRCTK